jgi:RimJ/RimL family protein N-acetyltransferase
MTVSIRPARPDDLDFLVELLTDDDVEPFLAGVRRDRETLAAEVERTQAEPDAFGRMLIELDGERAGTMRWELANERNAIAHLGGLAVHPRFRGAHLADEAARLLQRHLLLERGLHRLQLECYGFNDRAIRHAERAGFVREGVKRKAYNRHGEWVDGVMFGLLREDLEG